MGDKQRAAEAIKRIANLNEATLLICNVDSVNGSTCDVTPISGEAPLKQVRLNTNIDSDLGVVITPTIGSKVIVCQLNRLDSFIAMFSEIETVSIKVGSSSILIEDGKITLNGGNKNGLVEVSKMVNWMQYVKADLMTLQTLLLSLGVTFTPTTPTPIENQFANTEIIQ